MSKNVRSYHSNRSASIDARFFSIFDLLNVFFILKLGVNPINNDICP